LTLPAILSDNRALAMKQLVVLFAIAAAAAGCGKSSDLRPLKEETNGLVSGYAERLAALDLRKQDLIRRGNALQLGPDSMPASAQLGEVINEIIPSMQALVRSAPGKLESIDKDPKLDEQQKLVQVRALAYQLDTQLTNGWIRANTKLDAVDAWLARVETRPRAQQQAPQPPPPPGGTPPMPTQPPAGEPAGGTGGAAGGAGGTGGAAGGAGDAAGAAGGTYPAGQPQQGSDAANAAK
jgi:hypothetical protein